MKISEIESYPIWSNNGNNEYNKIHEERAATQLWKQSNHLLMALPKARRTIGISEDLWEIRLGFVLTSFLDFHNKL